MNFKRLAALTIAVASIASATATDNKSAAETLHHFAWGADIATSIDMTGNDMSTFDLNAAFGYKNAAVHMAGAGAGLHIAVNNDTRMFPVYGIVRTCFTRRPSRCFMEAKAGYSFNTMPDSSSDNGIYGSLGLGVNLAMGVNFRSFIIAAYTYSELPKSHDIHAVTIGIGIGF